MSFQSSGQREVMGSAGGTGGLSRGVPAWRPARARLSEVELWQQDSQPFLGTALCPALCWPLREIENTGRLNGQVGGSYSPGLQSQHCRGWRHACLWPIRSPSYADMPMHAPSAGMCRALSTHHCVCPRLRQSFPQASASVREGGTVRELSEVSSLLGGSGVFLGLSPISL